MPTEAEFLAAILAAPDDDAPRLIYADWLDERGESDRAEFIRIGCEAAAMQDAGRPACDHRYRPPTTPPLPKPKCPGCRYARKYRGLRNREGELLDSLAPGNLCLKGTLWAGPAASLPPQGHFVFRCGFVWRVECLAQQWLAHGPAIVAAQPVRRLTLRECLLVPSADPATIIADIDGLSITLQPMPTGDVARTYIDADLSPLFREPLVRPLAPEQCMLLLRESYRRIPSVDLDVLHGSLTLAGRPDIVVELREAPPVHRNGPRPSGPAQVSINGGEPIDVTSWEMVRRGGPIIREPGFLIRGPIE